MRVCPKCGYEEPPCWKRSFQHNPNGDIDVTRIDWLSDWEPELAKEIGSKRGQVIESGIFVYKLGKKGVWVKRVLLSLYKSGGESIWAIPYESGKPKTNLQNQTKLLETTK
jgi:hypothetical protein